MLRRNRKIFDSFGVGRGEEVTRMGACRVGSSSEMRYFLFRHSVWGSVSYVTMYLLGRRRVVILIITLLIWEWRCAC